MRCIKDRQTSDLAIAGRQSPRSAHVRRMEALMPSAMRASTRIDLRPRANSLIVSAP